VTLLEELIENNCGFSKFIDACCAYITELWGLFEELKLAWNRGYKCVERVNFETMYRDASECVYALVNMRYEGR
jgi:hypothetical protein